MMTSILRSRKLLRNLEKLRLRRKKWFSCLKKCDTGDNLVTEIYLGNI